MGSTVHFTSGRGLQRSARCRSLESWASFNSFWFFLLSAVYLAATILLDLSTIEKVMGIVQSVLWLVISLLVSKVAIKRRDRGLLELFLITLFWLTMECLLLLAFDLYMYIKYDMKRMVDAALRSGALKQIVAHLFEANVVDTLPYSTRKTIVLVYIGLFAAILLLALDAIVQTIRLWREYSKKGNKVGSSEWLLENGSYATAPARSDGAKMVVNVIGSGNTVKIFVPSK